MNETKMDLGVLAEGVMEGRRRPVSLGHRLLPPVHAPFGPDQFALRLRDVRADTLRFQRGSGRVPRHPKPDSGGTATVSIGEPRASLSRRGSITDHGTRRLASTPDA